LAVLEKNARPAGTLSMCVPFGVHVTLEDSTMRKATCLLGALGLVTLTAGCVQDSQYPTTGYSPGRTTTYSSQPVYATGSSYSPGYTATYSSPPVYATGSSYSPGYITPAPSRQSSWDSSRRDYDRDGVPNRYDSDANGDRVPDRYQGRPAPR
jgi:hypothetical protein